MSRYTYIVVLILAGEMVFGLPFHTARFFRPTMLEVFGFTNTQLGDLFAIYGIAALISYFPGGALADRFSARVLLTASLLATGVGGLFMATIPGAIGMGILYAFWGVTTIFLFWGALIRATREWGSDTQQGATFGLLEGGRGFVAAFVALVLVELLGFLMPADATAATDAERLFGFQMVVLGYSVTTIFIGLLAWFLVPDSQSLETRRTSPFPYLVEALGRPPLWVLAAIVVCAYCTYKSLDYYSLYLVQVMGMDEVQGARVATWGSYIRIPAALLAGWVADRFDAARSTAVVFTALALAYGALSQLVPETTSVTLIYANFVVTLIGMFALRGIYFALLQDSYTPRYMTGAAVGLVSVIGFTPEIFFGPIAGRILDAAPGAPGFQNLFALLATICVAGVLIAWLLIRMKRNISEAEPVR